MNLEEIKTWADRYAQHDTDAHSLILALAEIVEAQGKELSKLRHSGASGWAPASLTSAQEMRLDQLHRKDIVAWAEHSPSMQ